MPIVRRGSVRTSLVGAILLTILLSWVLGSGIANYFNYLVIRSIHQEMIGNPQSYPRPIDEPKFGVVEFLTGRPAFHRGPRPEPDHRPRVRPEGSRANDPSGRPPGPPPEAFEWRWLAIRLVTVLGLATLAGVWLGHRFTGPLKALAQGAEAYHAGNFEYRIPANGENEFAAVATAMNGMAQQVADHIRGLEDDAERRRQFMADIAHELRSPVTTMRTMAGALQDGVANEPGRRERAISSLVGTSERLLRLVRDLMELAKLDLNELPLNKREIDIRELANQVIRSYEADASSAGIILHPIEPAAPVKAVVDPDRITQALDNLVGNAVSYAGQGAGVWVSLEGADPLRITVRDTGKGIPAESLPYVLDPFFRADAARTPGDCHSGLGLSIARKLIEAHGGTFEFVSMEGKGTTVTMLIPGSTEPAA